jgi:hypothetical protein
MKRIAAWSAAVLFAALLYAGGAPFVRFAVADYLPALQPISDVVYAQIGSFLPSNFRARNCTGRTTRGGCGSLTS